MARAILYDAEGAPMATYTRLGSEPVAVPARQVAAREHRDGYLHVFEPVMHLQVQQGTLYLAAASDGLRIRVAEATNTVVLAGLAAILVAALLAWLLQRSLTRPILRLAETMGRINDPAMFPPRASYVSQDEIGVLYRGFNRMLDQLAAGEQERDRSGARLRALIAALPDPVFVLEENGEIAEVLAGRPDALTLPVGGAARTHDHRGDRHRAQGELRTDDHDRARHGNAPAAGLRARPAQRQALVRRLSRADQPSTRTGAAASGWCCSSPAT